MHEIVKELVHLIETQGWKERFDEAVRMAASYKIPAIAHIRTLQDYLDYIDGLVTWAPVELASTELSIKTNLYDHFVKLYFILDQPPVRALQVEPGSRTEKRTPLSDWIIRYAEQWGDYLDTIESARHVKTFKDDPKFNWDDYMPPPSDCATSVL